MPMVRRPLASRSMFSTGDYVIGLLAGLIVGLAKTAIPGAALLATPLLTLVFSGRAIAGAALPILLLADVFAVRWYRQSARWDLLWPLAPWVAIGFAAGAWFFIVIGAGGRTLDLTIGIVILVVVALQAWRMIRRVEPVAPSTRADAFYGVSGGFATFVSNNAGPILNTHLLRLGLDKRALVGTSAWFYFAVNVTKAPIYLALGWWSAGGGFFTGATVRYDVVVAPAVVVGVVGGRRLFEHVPQRLFLVVVMVLAAAGATNLIVG